MLEGVFFGHVPLETVARVWAMSFEVPEETDPAFERLVPTALVLWLDYFCTHHLAVATRRAKDPMGKLLARACAVQLCAHTPADDVEAVLRALQHPVTQDRYGNLAANYEPVCLVLDPKLAHEGVARAMDPSEAPTDLDREILLRPTVLYEESAFSAAAEDNTGRAIARAGRQPFIWFAVSPSPAPGDVRQLAGTSALYDQAGNVLRDAAAARLLAATIRRPADEFRDAALLHLPAANQVPA